MDSTSEPVKQKSLALDMKDEAKDITLLVNANIYRQWRSQYVDEIELSLWNIEMVKFAVSNSYSDYGSIKTAIQRGVPDIIKHYIWIKANDADKFYINNPEFYKNTFEMTFGDNVPSQMGDFCPTFCGGILGFHADINDSPTALDKLQNEIDHTLEPEFINDKDNKYNYWMKPAESRVDFLLDEESGSSRSSKKGLGSVYSRVMGSIRKSDDSRSSDRSYSSYSFKEELNVKPIRSILKKPKELKDTLNDTAEKKFSPAVSSDFLLGSKDRIKEYFNALSNENNNQRMLMKSALDKIRQGPPEYRKVVRNLEKSRQMSDTFIYNSKYQSFPKPPSHLAKITQYRPEESNPDTHNPFYKSMPKRRESALKKCCLSLFPVRKRDPDEEEPSESDYVNERYQDYLKNKGYDDVYGKESSDEENQEDKNAPEDLSYMEESKKLTELEYYHRHKSAMNLDEFVFRNYNTMLPNITTIVEKHESINSAKSDTPKEQNEDYKSEDDLDKSMGVNLDFDETELVKRMSHDITRTITEDLSQASVYKLTDVTDFTVLLTDVGVTEVKRILWCLNTYFNNKVEFMPIIPSLCCLLLIYLSPNAALCLLYKFIETCINNNTQEIGSRYFFINRKDFVKFVTYILSVMVANLKKTVQHLRYLRVDLAAWVARSVQTGFSQILPFDYIVRIYGSFLFEGESVLCRYCVALVKCISHKLLRTNVKKEAEQLLYQIGVDKSIQIDKVTKIAYSIVMKKFDKDIMKVQMPTPYLMNVRITSFYRPRLSTKSQILSEVHWEVLWSYLNTSYCILDPKILYSSNLHGITLLGLIKRLVESPLSCAPSLVFIQTDKSHILGAFIPKLYNTTNKGYFTSSEMLHQINSFIFTLYPQEKPYYFTSKNGTGIKLSEDKLIVGANDPAIILDKTLSSGHTASCQSYDSPPLVPDQYFNVRLLELWTLS